MFGDGVTVKKIPLMNILQSGVYKPKAVMDIINCTGHLVKGGKKDARYIAICFKPFMKELDPEETRMDCIFYGASNIQKAGRCLEAKFPRLTVLHGAEHVVSLFFIYVAKLMQINKLIGNYHHVYKVFGLRAMNASYALFQKQANNFNGGRKIRLI
mgnify:CR=1 FL=1